MTKTLEQAVDGLIVKAVKTWNMIEEDDKILIAASGGKDSAIMARTLGVWKKHNRINVKLEALHIRNDFSPNELSNQLQAEYFDWGIPLHILEIPVQARLKSNRKMNCYWCSTQRRTELIKFALENNFNSIALGHHLDDVLETLFMNMANKAEFSTMPPVVHYKKYPLKVIRPLYLTEEKQIVSYIKLLGLNTVTCTCGFNDHSERDAIRQRIEAFTQGSSLIKRNLLESMRHVNTEYLPS